MISKWHIIEPRGRRKGCLVALPGRAISAELMEKFCKFTELDDSMMVILEPRYYEWYPAPNGPEDQEKAVNGISAAVTEINKRIAKIQRSFHLKRQQICLIGYSAGAVMALQVLSTSKQPFGAVVSFAGAILEPAKLPQAMTQTPVLLRHAINDDCFKWEERYLPMKNALLEKGYNLYTSERQYGGHGMSIDDAEIIGRFAKQYLGY